MGHLALKSNISKAYDRLEWVFLKKVMERMGFRSRWVDNGVCSICDLLDVGK